MKRHPNCYRRSCKLANNPKGRELAVRGIRATLALWLLSHRLPADVRYDVRLWIGEALTNATVWGYQAGARRMWVHVDIRDGRILMRVRDDGAGADLKGILKRELAQEPGAAYCEESNHLGQGLMAQAGLCTVFRARRRSVFGVKERDGNAKV